MTPQDAKEAAEDHCLTCNRPIFPPNAPFSYSGLFCGCVTPALVQRSASLEFWKSKYPGPINEEALKLKAERDAALARIAELEAEIVKRNQYKINQEYLDNAHKYYEQREQRLVSLVTRGAYSGAFDHKQMLEFISDCQEALNKGGSDE